MRDTDPHRLEISADLPTPLARCPGPALQAMPLASVEMRR
jgi:hypothetical protein